MTNDELIKSLEIFRQYRDSDRLCIIPEHDCLYANTDKDVSKEDIAELVEIGWEQDNDDGYNEQGEWMPESYDIDIPWIIFV